MLDDSLLAALLFASASAACACVSVAARSGVLKGGSASAAQGDGASAPAPPAVLLSVLTELAGAAETVLEEGLPAAVASARAAATAAASRGLRPRALPPVDRLYEALVSEAGEACASRAGVTDSALGSALAGARARGDSAVLALEARVLASSPLAGVGVQHALAAMRAAARAESDLWRASAAHVRRRGGADAPPPGSRAFSAAVRREWRARRAAQQPLPPPYDRVLPAGAHVLTNTTAAIVALGPPWTPPRAALWQEIALALQPRDSRGEIARASSLAQRDEEALLAALGVAGGVLAGGDGEEEEEQQ